MSGLVAARRSLLAEDYRDRSSSSQPEVPKVMARFPGSFKETTDSSRQDQKPHVQVVGHQKEDGRHSSKDPILVSVSTLASFRLLPHFCKLFPFEGLSRCFLLST